eukprot:Rhum_TRINITY_DN14551_c3_g1::Rhum_TRINITY_DN14551_c3_g1_i1::g.95849::m.95849
MFSLREAHRRSFCGQTLNIEKHCATASRSRHATSSGTPESATASNAAFACRTRCADVGSSVHKHGATTPIAASSKPSADAAAAAAAAAAGISPASVNRSSSSSAAAATPVGASSQSPTLSSPSPSPFLLPPPPTLCRCVCGANAPSSDCSISCDSRNSARSDATSAAAAAAAAAVVAVAVVVAVVASLSSSFSSPDAGAHASAAAVGGSGSSGGDAGTVKTFSQLGRPVTSDRQMRPARRSYRGRRCAGVQASIKRSKRSATWRASTPSLIMSSSSAQASEEGAGGACDMVPRHAPPSSNEVQIL